MRRLSARPLRGGQSLVIQLVVPLALFGALLVAGLTAAYAAYSLDLVRVDQQRQANQGLTTIAQLISRDERSLVGTAHALVDTRGVTDALSGVSMAGLRAELVKAEVNQSLDLVLLVDARRTELVSVNVPRDLLAQTHTVETATLLLDASAMEWIGDELWMLAAAVHRRTDGVKDGVIVAGRRLDQRYLDDLGLSVGAPVGVVLAGRSVGPSVVPQAFRATRTVAMLFGGEVQLVTFTPTAAADRVAANGILTILATGVVPVVLFIGLSLLVVRRATRPLRALAAAAAAVAAGERGRIAPTTGSSEVTETGRAFNHMIAAVAEHERELERMNTATSEAAVQLEHQALHDGLTGLPNRALLHDRIGQAIATAKRQSGVAALLVLDLDKFKEVNDEHGHATGDAFLIAVAASLKSLVRETDTIARLGGDEFAIVLPGLDAVVAKRAADRAQRVFARAFHVNDLVLSVGASVGIATYPDHGVDAETLLKHADVAMYVAKRGGGGSTVVFSADQAQEDGTKRALLNDLRDAVREDRLLLHYQPIVSLANDEVVALEALARWQHPTRGLVPPTEFIPLAESTGVIKALTRSVLRLALRDAAQLRATGLDLPVAVNLSMHNLLDRELLPTMTEVLREAGAEPGWLHLEITESAIMADPELAMNAVSGLRALGIRLSIDDFGTGYSSLAYLNRLAVHEVKIDRSFVMHAVDDAGSATIVRATVDLGHALGLSVVAEGVEDEPTLSQLRRVGCDLAQGYLIARPMPLGELRAWLAARTHRSPILEVA